jgi:hypothetical protein
MPAWRLNPRKFRKKKRRQNVKGAEGKNTFLVAREAGNFLVRGKKDMLLECYHHSAISL